MEEVADKINEFVSGYDCNESLASILRKSVNGQSNKKSTPKTYYYVTDLCNPCEYYWKIVKPDIKRPNDLLRKLFRGKELHKRASYWLSALEEFSVYEGKIDGIYVGLPGVRGAIDYLLGNKILDLKTKEKIPLSPEEVLANFPQDVEQVAFYSAIHPENPIENYLLFMQSTNPFDLRAYKITIKNFGRIKSLILDRMKKLDFAIENKNPSQLGRSRYHYKSCHLCDEKLCDCETLTPLSTESLKLAVEVTYDESFTKRLTDLRNKINISSSIFTNWNVLAPIEYYKEAVLGAQSPASYDEEKDEYALCLRNLVDQLPYKINLNDRQAIRGSLKEHRLYLGFRWLKIPSSGNPAGNLTPYIIKVSNVSNPKYVSRPNSFNMAQLGIITSAYGKTRGIIFMVYPKLNDLIQTYEITYQKPSELLKYISSILDLLEKSVREKNISLLPPNPSFVKTDLQTQLE